MLRKKSYLFGSRWRSEYLSQRFSLLTMYDLHNEAFRSNEQIVKIGFLVAIRSEPVRERETQLSVLVEVASTERVVRRGSGARIERIGSTRATRAAVKEILGERVQVGLEMEQLEDLAQRIGVVGRDTIEMLDENAMRVANLLHGHVHDRLGQRH